MFVVESLLNKRLWRVKVGKSKLWQKDGTMEQHGFMIELCTGLAGCWQCLIICV